MRINHYLFITCLLIGPVQAPGLNFIGDTHEIIITTMMQNPQGDFSGAYTLSYEGTTLTLVLRQDANGTITGNLTSTTQISYQLEGQVSEGAAVGICYDQQGGDYFEAYFAEQQLIFSMIEPDEFNMPDYNKVQTLIFTRTGAGSQVPGMGRPQSTEIQYPAGNASPLSSDLMNHFAGSWTTTTTNTQTWVTFRTDGTFSDQYESSYSGDYSNQYGNDMGGWGTYNQQSAAGRWSVSGTREQGTIIIIYNNGTQRAVEYRVHSENGQVYYNEYWFNGVFYYKEK